jgi:dipeptidyl aminopeptidase/acylaminoacyl peptidase
MKTTFLALALTACAALSLDTAAEVNAAAPLPISAFFNKSATTGAALSPNGRFVAVRMLSPQGRTMLTVFDVATRKSQAIANFRNADVDLFFWLSDERLAFTLVNVDHDGDAGRPGAYAVNRDGKERTSLTEILVGKRSFADSDDVNHDYPSQYSLRGFPLRKEETLDVIEREGEGNEEASLVRLNTRNARRFPVRAPSGTHNWLTDAEGNLRVATARRAGRVANFYLDNGDWRQLDSRDAKAESTFDPLLYVDGALYVRSRNGGDEAQVYRYDLAKNAIAAKPLITAPGFDTDGYFILSDKKMLGFRFTTDAEVTVWFDQRMKELQQEVDQMLPGTVNNLARGTASETPYVLIDAYSDVQSHVYILYNAETKERTLLGKSKPDVAADQMAQMTMVRYRARDGLQIPAFLTLPNTARQKKLPTVVLLGRQEERRSAKWEWNAEVQFLASRGYAVLQPEPRGTKGYGRTHLQAGAGQAGRAAQNDIADAVKWAVAEGHTDPARVCIAGTGYGGYAAMMALLKNPDTFKCGISWSGMTGYENNPDDAGLKDIKRPVLLAYGTEDEAVSYKQGLAFYQALKAGNPQAEWLEYTPAVEDWTTQKNRIDLWRNIESFLARQVGAE